MFHIPDAKSSFYALLLKIDEDTLHQAQRGRCPSCQGVLDRADFPRKPRGLPETLPEEFGLRFSLCCRHEGCRKRLTPPSVRFWGRRVYTLFFVVMSSSVGSGSFSELKRMLGLSRQTLKRWQCYWTRSFGKQPAGKEFAAFSCRPLVLTGFRAA